MNRALSAIILRVGIAFKARVIAGIAHELILVSVERIWAFFKTGAIQRIKILSFVARRTIIRRSTHTVFARRVTNMAIPRIVIVA